MNGIEKQMPYVDGDSRYGNIKSERVSLGAGGIMDSVSQGSSGLAFYTGELEKRAAKILEPLSSTTWPRDIPADIGGGPVTSVSVLARNYADAGLAPHGFVRGRTTEIARVSHTTKLMHWPTFNFRRAMHIDYIDRELMKRTGRLLDDALRAAIQMAYDKEMDYNVYYGFEELGTYGLVNNPHVPVKLAEKGASGARTWRSKTPLELLRDINDIVHTTWKQSGDDVAGMANHILVPPDLYTHITSAPITDAGSQSTLEYLIANNVGRRQGVNITVHPCRWLEGAGVNGTNRMIGYANHADNLEITLTVPLRLMYTDRDSNTGAYVSHYIAQYSQVQFKRPQTIAYIDGV